MTCAKIRSLGNYSKLVGFRSGQIDQPLLAADVLGRGHGMGGRGRFGQSAWHNAGSGFSNSVRAVMVSVSSTSLNASSMA